MSRSAPSISMSYSQAENLKDKLKKIANVKPVEETPLFELSQDQIRDYIAKAGFNYEGFDGQVHKFNYNNHKWGLIIYSGSTVFFASIDPSKYWKFPPPGGLVYKPNYTGEDMPMLLRKAKGAADKYLSTLTNQPVTEPTTSKETKQPDNTVKDKKITELTAEEISNSMRESGFEVLKVYYRQYIFKYNNKQWRFTINDDKNISFGAIGSEEDQFKFNQPYNYKYWIMKDLPNVFKEFKEKVYVILGLTDAENAPILNIIPGETIISYMEGAGINSPEYLTYFQNSSYGFTQNGIDWVFEIISNKECHLHIKTHDFDKGIQFSNPWVWKSEKDFLGKNLREMFRQTLDIVRSYNKNK